MTTKSPDAPLKFYPSYCFTNSPTYHVWAKLTAADVRALTELPEFVAQNTYFYLNHPIRWVCVTGVVVAIDEFEKRTILYLDDGSGEGIDIVCERPLPPPASADTDPPPDISLIDVGSTIRAKGKITVFRNARQICLKRVHILPDTMSEVGAWRGVTKFRAEVLMRPWELDEREVEELKAAAYGEVKEGRKGRDRRRRRVREGKRNEEKRKKSGDKLRKELLADRENAGDDIRTVIRQTPLSPTKEEKGGSKRRKIRRHPPHLDALGL